jgi:sugar fermentation stimulation protein A
LTPVGKSATPPPSPDAWLTYPTRLRRALVLARPNRFVLHVRLDDGTEAKAHLGDSGRLTELGRSGWTVLVDGPYEAPRLPWRAVAADAGDAWVSLRPIDANRLARLLLERGFVPELAGGVLRAEVPMGRHRFDFAWTDGVRRALIEVKSASLVIDGEALFPDAVSERASRHVEALMGHARDGFEPWVLFMCQRADARLFRPAEAIDPVFARTFRHALGEGLNVRAFRFAASPLGVDSPSMILVDPPQPR